MYYFTNNNLIIKKASLHLIKKPFNYYLITVLALHYYKHDIRPGQVSWSCLLM